ENRHLGRLLGAVRPIALVARLVEARGTGVLAPFCDIADVEIPKIYDALAARQLDELHALVESFDAIDAIQRVDSKARGDRRLVADGGLHLTQGLDPEAGAVLE